MSNFEFPRLPDPAATAVAPWPVLTCPVIVADVGSVSKRRTTRFTEVTPMSSPMSPVVMPEFSPAPVRVLRVWAVSKNANALPEACQDWESHGMSGRASQVEERELSVSHVRPGVTKLKTASTVLFALPHLFLKRW